jgi:hypothetical protein
MSVSRSSTVIPAVAIGGPIRTVTLTGRTTALPFRIDAPAAADGHGNHRHLRLQGHDETALLERQQLTGAAARALRKDEKRVPTLQRLDRLSTDAIDFRRSARSTATKPPRSNAIPISGIRCSSCL